MADPSNNFEVTSDTHPLSYMVVRGETVFCRCRDVEPAKLVCQWYQERSKKVGTKLSYE